uniref:Coiled-coil domain containing 78 n=1 Tax=Lepisosteus oculatus TaxID=7918 RepID=W5M5T3_LEPOC
MNSPEDSGNVSELREHIARLTNENIQLRDKNERLFSKLGDLQDKLGQLAGSKTDLSSKLVFSEEEKLKVQKAASSVLLLSGGVSQPAFQYSTFQAKVSAQSVLATCNLSDLIKEKLDKELLVWHEAATIGVHLHILVCGWCCLQVSRNEELSAELLGLARAQDDLLKQQESQARTRALYGEAAQELERVRAVVSRLSQRRVRPEHLASLEQERRTLEKSELLIKLHRIGDGKKSVTIVIADEYTRVILVLFPVCVHVQDHSHSSPFQQPNCAYHSPSLIILLSFQLLVSFRRVFLRSTLRVSPSRSEYSSCFFVYIKKGVDLILHNNKGFQMACFFVNLSHLHRGRDPPGQIAVFRVTVWSFHTIWSNSQESNPCCHLKSRDCWKMNHFIKLQYIELLNYQKVKQDLVLFYEVDLTQQNIHSTGTKQGHYIRTGGKASEEAWADIRKQLREFTHSTQEEQERERAQLITRATVAEEQVSELQEYVDKHLARYKQEITRLRKLLGTDTGRAHSADAPEAHLLRHAKRNPSYEL